jgi:hypothetical protein
VPYAEAAEDLELLKAMAGQPRGGQLFGTVFRAEDARLLSPNDPRNGGGAFPGIPGARVRVTGPVSRQYTTGFDGRYNIRDLPPGTYQFSLLAPPGLAPPGPPLPPEHRVPERPTTVTFERPFECARRYFQVRTDSRITGVLHDSRGSPVRNVPVDLVRADAVGRDGRALRITMPTDSMGAFVFAFMPPGRYHVAARGALYHPGVRTRSDATVVDVVEGTRAQLPPMRIEAR